MLHVGFATTAPTDIASQLSPVCSAWAEQSLSVSARQNTGQNSVRVKQIIAVMRSIRAYYQVAAFLSAATTCHGQLEPETRVTMRDNLCNSGPVSEAVLRQTITNDFLIARIARTAPISPCAHGKFTRDSGRQISGPADKKATRLIA